MKRLILWDIDGTLIAGGGIAGKALRAAMERCFGPIEAEPFSYAGKTDQQIIMESYPDRSDIALPDALEHFTPLYLNELNSYRDSFLTSARALPGVAAALETLHQDPDVIQSLLTGNLIASARIKLNIFELDQYIDFEVGAYGSDHHHRPELVPFAVQRAEQRYGKRFADQQVVVIGDTPNDIACGQAANARTIAVATGQYSTAELREAGADLVFEDLSNTDAVLAAIRA